MVLFFLDPIDEWVAQGLTEYDSKPVKSIAKGDVDFDDQDEEDSSESSSCSESDDDVDDGDSLSNVGSYREEYHGVSLKSIVTGGFAASKSKSQSDLDRFDTLKNPLESGTELELERESSLTDREQGPAKWRRRADSVVSHGSW